MTNFMDLPKPVRKRIYRLYLIADKQPVTLEEHRAARPSRLLRGNRAIEQEAAPIYFGENTFGLHGPEELREWKRSMRRHYIEHIARVVLLHWSDRTPIAANNAFKALGELPGLRFLAVVIDEEAELRSVLACDPIIRCAGKSGIGPQLHRQLLRLPGMMTFSELSNVHTVKFIKSAGAFASESDEDTGSLPGGLLETIKFGIIQNNLSKMERSKDRPFRFLDLPPEIRNLIYSMLLVFPGATYPIADKPISVTSQFKYKSEAARATFPVPRSALDLLLVNRQVNDEAHGFFYRNDLVFPTPARLQCFMLSLGKRRLDCLRSLTLFSEHGRLVDKITKGGEVHQRYPAKINFVYENQGPLEGIDKMGVAMLLVRLLPNLQKLHLMHRSVTMDGVTRTHSRFSTYGRDLQFNDIRFMFEMRNIPDIKIRDLDLELVEEEHELVHEAMLRSGRTITASYLEEYEHELQSFRRNNAALKHLNHGLQLAQKGVVVHELFAGGNWRERMDWPKLEGSDCGLIKGCSCGPSDDKNKEIEEVSHH